MSKHFLNGFTTSGLPVYEFVPNIPDKGENWQPIETAPKDQKLNLATFHIPSETAQRNGSKPNWVYGSGYWIYEGHFSGILGANPSHWKPA